MTNATPSRGPGQTRALARRVFTWPVRTWEARKPDLEALRARHPEVFATPRAAGAYLSNIRMPRSFRWALKSVDKAGSSTALRVLFELEFGVPLTVEVDSPGDINSDVVTHMGLGAGLFLSPADVQGGVAALESALRLATVRDPASRALSAFFYICRTQDLRSPWMAHDRLRLSALTGFDWTRHARTPDGFLRFLDYVAQAHDTARAGGLPVNTHWLGQWETICPAIFRPDLIGRTEDLDRFFRDLAQRLDQPLPQGWTAPRSNALERCDAAPFLTLPETRQRIAAVYALDFEAFGYDI